MPCQNYHSQSHLSNTLSIGCGCWKCSSHSPLNRDMPSTCTSRYLLLQVLQTHFNKDKNKDDK